MFKNLKLGAKISLGFATLIIIATLLGIVSYTSISNLQNYSNITKAVNDSMTSLSDCAKYRRDFQITGFAKDDTGQTNIDKWNKTDDELSQKLRNLAANKSLDNTASGFVNEAIKSNEAYKKAFMDLVSARQMCDDGFSKWSKTGADVMAKVDDAMINIITPARLEAQKVKDTEAIAKWADWADGLNAKVINEFLKLRIKALYAIAMKTDESWSGYQTALKSFRDGIEAWSTMIAGNSQLENVVKQLQQYASDYEAAGQVYRNGLLAERNATGQTVTTTTALVGAMNSLLDKMAKGEQSLKARTNVLMTSAMAGSILIGILLAVVITRSITKPINNIIAGLTDGAAQVASASGQVSAASQSLAEGATEQAAGLEETSSSLEEMSSMTKQSADNAQQAATLAGQSKNAAANGAKAMSKMNGAINEIQKSSDATAKIIKVIDEIAFQTNLLALNAAVEAARAGEAGKGFAVVAEEVRNLAMRSAEAAKNTAAMIEESVKNSKNGVDITNEVTSVLEEIVTSISKTADLVSEIAASSQEQAKGIDQVNTAVAQMDKITQSNAANAEESASASEELNAQAATMNDIVAELSALVGGSNSKNHATQASSKKLGLTDKTFHAIAGGKTKASIKKNDLKSQAKSGLPLHDDDLKDFNS